MRNMRKSLILAAATLILSVLLSMQSSRAFADEPFIGEILWVPYTFCPRGYAEASGQILPIATNTALFSLLGTTYGGDGRTTFALPDLRGRVTIGQGLGPGLSDYPLGANGGVESTSLTEANIPVHTHTATTTVTGTGTPRASSQVADSVDPGGNVWAMSKKNKDAQYTNNTPDIFMKSDIIQLNAEAETTIDPSGTDGSLDPIENRQPYLVLRPCIALVGIFPSRN